MSTLTYPSTSVQLIRWPWIMLLARTTLFISIQAFFALGFFLVGSANAWDDSAAWWPVVVVFANLICLMLLIWLYRVEGQRYWDIFRIERKHVLGDLLFIVGIFVIGGPLAYFPNVLLAGWLFDKPQTVLELFVRPLPLWAVWAGLFLFPITQGLVEIALYMAYVMPRIEAQGLRPWQAVLLSGFFLGIQHFAVPLLFDGRFFVWRLLMYIPFACWTALVMRWRPRLLPYIAVVHVLMNMSFATMFFGVAY